MRTIHRGRAQLRDLLAGDAHASAGREPPQAPVDAIWLVVRVAPQFAHLDEQAMEIGDGLTRPHVVPP